MSKRQEWIDKALDELHSVGEMADSIERNLYVSGDLASCRYVAGVIETHGRDAKRYLSYALRCREEPDED